MRFYRGILVAGLLATTVGTTPAVAQTASRLGPSMTAIPTYVRGSSVAYDYKTGVYLVVSAYGNLNGVFVTADGAVGASFTILDSQGVGYVEQLAVERSYRGKGLAQALLSDAFGQAREHGATRSELSTDSRSGALDLYLKLGMEVTQVWTHLVTDLPR